MKGKLTKKSSSSISSGRGQLVTKPVVKKQPTKINTRHKKYA